MTDAKVEGQLLGSLRMHEPHEVRAYFGESDEDFRKLAVPHAKVRKRWSRVLAAVEAKAWTRCELLDKSGAVLAYVANTAAPAELRSITSKAEKFCRPRLTRSWYAA